MKSFQKLFLLFILCSLLSCSQSEKDFLGEYTTYYVSHANVKNGMMSAGTSVITINTAMDIYLLDKISVNIFTDESTKKLSGNGNVVRSFAENGMSSCRLVRREYDIELSDYQLKGDSLFFKMNSKIFNKKITAYLLKSGDSTFIGISNSLGGKNAYVTKNPFFKEENNDCFQYYANLKNSDNACKTFYQNQVELNEGNIKSLSSTKSEKNRYATTNAYIKNKLLE